MDHLERASVPSIAKTHDSDPKAELSKKQYNESSQRKTPIFPRTTLQQDVVADDPVDPEVRSHRRYARTFLDLQDSYTRRGLTEYVNCHSKLDDLCRYGISASQEAKLWKLQTAVLDAATKLGITRNPLTSAVGEDWLPDHAGFKLLSTVAGEIIKNIAICDFDNRLVLFECQRESFDVKDLWLARSAILANAQMETNGSRATETAETNLTVSEEQRRKFSCALVDYVAAVTAKCTSRNRVGASWHALCMASLARVMAKLKFLAVDSEEFAGRCLNNGEEVLRSFADDADKRDADNFAQLFSASSWALESLRSIFSILKCEKRPGVLIDKFNIAAIVWETGWKDVNVMLSQDQFGNISGTSVWPIVWSTDEAFKTLVEVMKTIKDKPQRSTARKTLNRTSVFVLHYPKRIWNPFELSRSKKRRLETLADVVSFMIPLICLQPTQLAQLSRTSGLGTELGGFQNSYVRGRMARLPAFAELQVGLSSATGIDHFASTDSLPPPPTDWLSLVKPLAKKPTRKMRAAITSGVAQNWAIEEKSIVVSRRMYVITTMSACGVLVVGGILAGLLVGERIPGVDPFNIATFAWVLAAFIILIAKSLYVREWPWYDFLRGQVPCRSVSELHTVTGIDEQDILKYLLANDAHTILSTRGPFNLPFTRRSEDGFSIDAKMDLRTLIASGIVVFRVATHIGEALVCLDLRRGLEGRTSISHSDGPREGERLLGCFDFPDSIHGSSDVRLQTLSQSMTWERILVIYPRMDKKFR